MNKLLLNDVPRIVELSIEGSLINTINLRESNSLRKVNFGIGQFVVPPSQSDIYLNKIKMPSAPVAPTNG